MNFWLVKSEGNSYSIDDLKRDKKTAWEGIRNFQARNFMMQMRKGDPVLFYHSGSKPMGIFGVAKVASAPHPDETQFGEKSDYYEPRATREKPVWQCVDISYVKTFKEPVTLAEIKADAVLGGIMLAAPGSRLSVQPVSEKHFKHITESLARSS